MSMKNLSEAYTNKVELHKLGSKGNIFLLKCLLSVLLLWKQLLNKSGLKISTRIVWQQMSDTLKLGFLMIFKKNEGLG